MAFDYLKDLLSKAGQNLEASDQMIGDQTKLMGKQIKDSDYKPSEDEAANQKKYYDSVTGAVVGNISPTAGSTLIGKANPFMKGLTERSIPIMESMAPQIGSPLAQEAAATAASSGIMDRALQQAGKVGATNMKDVARSQQVQSRAVDAADRLKAQFAALKNKVR